MGINSCRESRIAQEVLKNIKKIAENTEKLFCVNIWSYCNGKEQGYKFICTPKAEQNFFCTVVFFVFEHRNIAVYQTNIVNMQGLNAMKEEDYIVKFFYCNEYANVAKHIIDTANAEMIAVKLLKNA